MIRFKKRKGFTIVELLVVLGVLAVIYAFAVPNSQGGDSASRWSATDNDAKTLRDAVMVYMASSRSGQAPNNLGELVTGVTAAQSKTGTATGALIIKSTWTTDPATIRDGWDNAFVYDRTAGTITSNCGGAYDPIVYRFR